MDKREETTRIVKSLNDYDNGRIRESEFIKRVCDYYDLVKHEELSDSDVKFLRFLANRSGIPQYFGLLNDFNPRSKECDEIDINTLSSIIYESTLHTTHDIVLHKYQKLILDSFKAGMVNRCFLSATTSFGKTFLVYEIIRKMQYDNIMLVFPSIALLSENLDKVYAFNNDDSFSANHPYTVHTLSDVAKDDLGARNIFIYTPERYLSFIENRQTNISFDFVFIDEIYKIDNDFIIDEEARENERDVAYRMATYHCTQNPSSDMLLAGSYIGLGKRSSFMTFLSLNGIIPLEYNDYEIVSKDVNEVQNKSKFTIDEDEIRFENLTKKDKLVGIANELINNRNENLIIYCASPAYAEQYANKLISSNKFDRHNSSKYSDFIEHLQNKIHYDWVLIKALRNGIGIHHGAIPKYIQKQIIQLFNTRQIHTLLCTTTITEGVNTSAKNIVVLHAKKDEKPLKPFDAKNIKGRAGRFQYHFKGRLISLEREFNDILDKADTLLQHKNYDPTIKKDEIDFFMTEDRFLNDADNAMKIQVVELSSNYPPEIFESYKMIKRSDKIKLYDLVNGLIANNQISISGLKQGVYLRSGFDFNELQNILNICNTIIPENSRLKSLIEIKRSSTKDDTKQYSNLVFLLYAYVRYGISGMIKYYADKANETDRDAKIRETSKLIFNTFKYQLVKYLGTFNLIYKTIISLKQNIPIENVQGIENFLSLLEYNAFSKNGKIASDYGVPNEVVKIIDANSTNTQALDPFEMSIYDEISRKLPLA